MTTVELVAPWTGWAVRLTEVPDPAFAQGMMGDGVAIDPLGGTLRAPADGVVTTVAPTGHAVVLELDNGAELLIHVGVDTVALQGKGFRPLVASGARVSQGTPLIEVDLTTVAASAKSLRTPMVVTNTGFRCTALAIDRTVKAGDPILRVEQMDGSAHGEVPAGTALTRWATLPPGHGLHARPAARIGATVKRFDARVRVQAKERSADTRSLTELMALGVTAGDSIRLTATGPDAEAALDALVELIEDGLEGQVAAPRAADTVSPPQTPSASQRRAVCAAPGLAVGPIHRLTVRRIEVAVDGRGVDVERLALDVALKQVAEDLDEVRPQVAGEVMAAHRALLEDPALIGRAGDAIAVGRSAGAAWRAATRAQADALRTSGEPRLIERTADLRDLEGRVLGRLTGQRDSTAGTVPKGVIVTADELLPSQFLQLADVGIAGIVTEGGGATSHVAILAAAAGVPMLVAAGPVLRELDDGQMVVLDADSSLLDLRPDPAALERAHARVEVRRERAAEELASAHQECRTLDGKRIEVFANLGSLADALAAMTAGAEGCGLLRTEFLFLDRTAAPDQEEQRASYAAIAAALDPHPLVVRTLDIGADKPVAYLPITGEANPALGLRGIRLSLSRPTLLRTQLNAILSAVPAHRCRIMVPMVVEPAEVLQVRLILDECRAERGIRTVPLGVMIETPAAALMADELADVADFLSIGTNDLTQYTLCIDRTNGTLASRADALHPAVLRLIAATTRGAARRNRPVGVCGALASDERAAPADDRLGRD